MAQIIRSVSINKEQAEFLDGNKELSLSKICQVSINRIMEDSSAHEVEINQLKRSNSVLQEALSEATGQLDKLNCNLEDGKWICPKKSSTGTRKSAMKDK